jgi:SAM-dependent methyltransferase
MSDITVNYTERYGARRGRKLYPVEFVVRTLLGSYPRLTMDQDAYRGAKILDLGCGDGRNLSLLADVGFTTFAVEITDAICEVVRAYCAGAGLDTVVKTGSNANIPFADGFFDFALCCHSLYYLDPGDTFADNLRELARVMRPGGTVIASLPKKYDSYTLKDAEPVGDDHFMVRCDPLNLRNGVVFKVFEDQAAIARACVPLFRDFQLGFVENDFFGIEEKLWIVKMTRS